MDDLSLPDLALVIVALASTFFVLAVAWLCAKVRNIEHFITAPITKDSTVEDALQHLQNDHDEAVVEAKEAARLARHTSGQVDVAAELGHQNAAGARVVAQDLAKSQNRADAEPSGVPGAAADAGLRSDPKETEEP